MESTWPDLEEHLMSRDDRLSVEDSICVVICRARWRDEMNHAAGVQVDDPEVATIAPTREAFHAIVPGFLGGWGIAPNLMCYHDDLGIARDLPPNRCGILGTFLVSAQDREGWERSLTDDETRDVLEWCVRGKDVLHPIYTGEPTQPRVPFPSPPGTISHEEIWAALNRKEPTP
jgi:hypothetical protein